MKKILILISTPILLVVAGFAVVLFLDDAPLTPGAPVCGLSLDTKLAVAIGSEAIENKWQVYSFASTSDAPNVVTTEKRYTDSPVASVARGCELAIKSLPDNSEKHTDWRIGFSSPTVENLRGKFIKARLFLRAENKASLSSGSFYVYDGKTVVAVGVSNIGQNWGEYEVVHQVPDGSDTFEIWFRLLFNNPVVTPAENTIQMVARLEETDAAAKRPRPAAPSSQFAPASCPLRVAGNNLNLQNTDDWLVYRWESTPAPDVEVSPQVSSSTSASPAAWCDLAITDGPTIPGKGIDWRMGHEFDVTQFQGKKVAFSAQMKATEATRLSSARLYTYDGKSVREEAVPDLSTDWQKFTLTSDVPEDAEVFQSWFRLVFDQGTVTPSDVTISFAPEIAIIQE